MYPSEFRSGDEVFFVGEGWVVKSGVVRLVRDKHGENIKVIDDGTPHPLQHVCVYKTAQGAENEIARYREREELRRPEIEKQDRLRAERGPFPGYVIKGGLVRHVRFSSNNNLVTQPGDVLIARRGEPWPTVYSSKEAAERALEEAIARCPHSWKWISHEERECHRCGAVEFIPDID